MQANLAKYRSFIILALDVIMIIVTVLAVVSLVIDLGGLKLSANAEKKLAILDWIIVGIFIAESFIKWGLQRFELVYLRRNWPDFVLVFLFLSLLLVIFGYIPKLPSRWLPLFVNLSIARAYILITRLYIVGSPLIRTVSRRLGVPRATLVPAQLIILSFLFVILMGTGFLLLPGATNSGEISFVDALFTATSATCVTGLIVVDTGSYFTHFGQMVILSLIQIGGLGLMTVTTFFALILGKSMSVKESIIMSDALGFKALSRIPRLTVYILVLTFVFESLGALFLWVTWSGAKEFEWGSVAYYSIFHSISAFCNAGFSLFQNNLENFKGNVIVNITITSLIIFGGLGFIVIVSLLRRIFKRERLSLHAKLVLVVTASLIVGGTLLVLMTEWNNALRDLSLSDKVMASYFQSVTPRTAGFNTISMGNLTYACYFMMIILMFIGASPGGTGGGIKTSTFGVIVGSIWSMLKARDSVEMFKRSIPREVVRNAFLLMTIVLAILSVFGFILLLTQKGDPIHIFFELFSAFGTVGLSAGITPRLTTLGKLIIITTMFIGRVGPLTLALAVGRRREAAYEYSEETVMVG